MVSPEEIGLSMSAFRQGRVVGPSEWGETAVPDIYFSYGYHVASGVLEPDFLDAALVEWSDGQGVIRLPLLLRRIQGSEYLDATSAYDYGGPWIEGDPDMGGFLSYLDEWARENSVVCTFLRFHPLLKNAERVEPFIPVRKVGVTFGWDLAEKKDMIAGMQRGHRYRYRQAVREGLESRITVHPADLDTFRDLYTQTMKRISAHDFFYFPDDYWAKLQEHVGENLVLTEAIYHDEVVASVLFMAGEKYLHSHFSGTTDAGRKIGASVFCNVALALWAQERGFSVQHLGGGPGGENSGLLTWKHAFDPEAPLNDFYVGGIVHNEKAYAALSADSMDKDFFPPWRARKSYGD